MITPALRGVNGGGPGLSNHLRMRSISMQDFVETVRRLATGGFATEPMTRLLTETRLHDEDLKQFLHFVDVDYTRTLIYRNDEVEILALCWPRNSATPIHDHGGQRCWMVAHSGIFTVDDYRQVAGARAPGRAVVERLFTAPNITVGMPDFRGSERDIHRVSVAPDCSSAVSIHVYAKPYTSCLIFDEALRQAREMRLNYDFTA